VETFGMRLKMLRESRKMSQEELAKLLNLSQSSIAYYELDKKQPSQRTIIRIAKIFNTPTDYLFGLTDNPVPSQTKPKKPNYLEHIQAAKTIGDAIQIAANLYTAEKIDEATYYDLVNIANKKFGLPPVKGSETAARQEYNVQASGVFEGDANEKNNP
jgi:transcriptional regulator with XRE-family HTH domain